MRISKESLAFLFIISTQSASAQWIVERNDSLMSFQQILFTDSLRGYIASYHAIYVDSLNSYVGGGSVLRTTAGGADWVEAMTGDTRLTSSVSVAGKFVWASTDLGKLYCSQDSGKSFVLKYTNESQYDFHTVFFVDSLTGWLIGNGPLSWPVTGEIILHTTDGGVTWIEQYKTVEPPSTPGHLFQGFFVDSLHGWVAHQYYMMHTFNGGKDWLGQSLNAAPDLFSVFALDTSRVWGVGEDSHGFITFSKDGGQHWMKSNTSMSSSVLSVFFADSSNGWVCCSDGTIARSTDGGKNWINQLSNISSKLASIFFTGQSTGWAVGDHGIILHTTNGGGATSVCAENSSPVGWFLGQNLPNPFNPTTRIQYSVAIRSVVDVKVYNVLGQLVKRLFEGSKEAGSYSIDFNGSDLPSGTYIYRLTASNGQFSFTQSREMVLLK